MMYAENIRDVLVASMSQFESTDSGTNLGVGWKGWDEAIDYARGNNLDCFGSVFLATGDEEEPKAFGYGMWRWNYYVRMHVKFDVTADPTPDEKVETLSSDFMDAILDSTNAFAITPTGYARVVAANYLGEPEKIDTVVYLTVEFLVAVKAQISRD